MSTSENIFSASTTSHSVVASNIGRKIGEQVARDHLANNEPWWWPGFSHNHKDALVNAGVFADSPWFTTAWLAARRTYDEIMEPEFTQIILSVNGNEIARPFHRKGRIQHCESRLSGALQIDRPDAPDVQWVLDLIEHSMTMGRNLTYVEIGDQSHSISWRNAH